MRKASPLLRSENLELLFGQKALGPKTHFETVVTDSRKASTGSLFFAVPGELTDGHAFIESALDKGSSGIVYQPQTIAPQALERLKTAGVWHLEVGDSLQALRMFAGAYRKEFNIPVIAVIGSVGKTSTKELIAALLQGKHSAVKKTEGSQNGYLGIPMTLLAWEEGLQAAVVEIGIDAIGAMQEHITLVRPTMTVLTRTGPEHLHQLKDEATATREECIGLSETLRLGGSVIVNGADPGAFAWWNQTTPSLKHSRRYVVGTDPTADFSASTNGNQITINDRENNTHTFALPLPGAHQASNFLAAYAAARTLGVNEAEIKKGLTHFRGAAGRTEIHALKNGGVLIADHYNSNPTSLKAALTLLSETAERSGLPSIAILADMLELGEEEETYHRAMAQTLKDANIKRVFLTGTRMKWLENELLKIKFSGLCTHVSDRSKLIEILTHESTSTKAVILVKGSRSMKLEEVLPLYEY